MDVLGYTILEEESLPGFLKGFSVKENIVRKPAYTGEEIQVYVKSPTGTGPAWGLLPIPSHPWEEACAQQWDLYRLVQYSLEYNNRKPQVALCMACAAALLLVTALSITIGIFIGYTYCYLEHKSGAIKADVSRTNIKIMPMPVYEYHNNKTRTINDALLNNYIISNLLRVSGLREKPSLTDNKVKELPEPTA